METIPISIGGSFVFRINAIGNVEAVGTGQLYSLSANPTSFVPSISSTPDGGGNWLAGADGGVFAFGDAGYVGSLGANPSPSPINGFAAA